MADAPRDQNFVPTGLMESSTNPGVVLPFKGSEATGRLLTWPRRTRANVKARSASWRA